MRTLLTLLLLPFVATPQSALPSAQRQRFASVLVVDAAGGAPYATIQAAINAATPGDTLLVRSGTYAGFDLVGKGLSIVGDAGSIVVCNSASTVSGVPIGQRALLQNLSLTDSLFGGDSNGLRITNDLGAVRVESCSMSALAWQTAAGLFVSNSPNVLLRECELHGGSLTNGGAIPGIAGAGGAAWNSQVIAYQSNFFGANGGGGMHLWSMHGGPGWHQTSGELRAERSSFHGGDGGLNTDCQYGSGGNGGPGLRLETWSVPPVVRALSSSFAGGAAGVHVCGYSGNDGPPTSGTGSFSSVPGPTRTLAAPTPVRDQSAVTFTASGAAGEAVFLLVSARDVRETSASYEGVLFAGASYLLRIDLGAAPASGTVSYTWSIPDDLVPPDLSLTLTAQAVFAATSGAVTLSNPVTLVVLDHAW